MQPAEVKRNFRLGVINGVFYILGETLLDPTLVLVAFLSHLTQSPILLGLVLPIRDGAWALPQLWVSGFLQSKRRKLPVYQGMSAVRVSAWVLLFVSINFIRDPAWQLVIFFVAYAAAALGSGISGLPFLEVVAKTIPSRRIGEFFAWRLGMGGLVGIGASLLVRRLLDTAGPLAFPTNFGLLAALYLVVGTSSQVCFNLVREPPSETVQVKTGLVEQVRQIPFILKRDLPFRRFLAVQSLLTVAASATPFFAVYFQQRMGVSAGMIGIYLAVYTASNLVSNLIFGRISLKYGNRRVFLTAAGAGMLMSGLVVGLVLLSPGLGMAGQIASLGLIPVFFLNAIRGTAIGVSSNAILLELSPLEKRSLYLGLYNSFVGLVTIATGISGLVVAAFGFNSLMYVTAGAHLVALIAALGYRSQAQGDLSRIDLEQIPQ